MQLIHSLPWGPWRPGAENLREMEAWLLQAMENHPHWAPSPQPSSTCWLFSRIYLWYLIHFCFLWSLSCSHGFSLPLLAPATVVYALIPHLWLHQPGKPVPQHWPCPSSLAFQQDLDRKQRLAGLGSSMENSWGISDSQVLKSGIKVTLSWLSRTGPWRSRGRQGQVSRIHLEEKLFCLLFYITCWEEVFGIWARGLQVDPASAGGWN